MGLFVTRGFIPAFLTAFLLKYGHEVPYLGGRMVFESAQQPTWFTHDATIIVLGILAFLEVAATKFNEAEEILDTFSHYYKGGMQVLTGLGVLSARDASFIEKNIQISEAGMSGVIFFVLLGGGVLLMASVRSSIKEVLIEADQEDDFGLRGILSWAEDLWAVFGVFLLLSYPVVMVALMAIVFGVMLAVKKYMDYREEKSKKACEQCGEKIYPSAIQCPKCSHALAAPCKVGAFGQVTQKPVVDLADHGFRLAEKKRCPICATRIKESAARPVCPACGHRLFGDDKFADAYVSRISRRLPVTLGICFGLSLVPMVGLIPGVIYYRMTLVSPFSGYLGAGSKLFARVALKIIFIVLITFQLVPGLGGFAVPIMAGLNFAFYRSAFVKQLKTSGSSIKAQVKEEIFHPKDQKDL